MLFLISPAKSLDYESPATHLPHTQPLFVKQAEPLIKALRKKSWRQVSKLMDLSQNLSELNVARYQTWQPEFNTANSKQALLAFDGDVYDGLVAKTLDAADLAWAQQHLCILSGLYGVLRPLDLMQPYRLEMGTQLKVGRPDNLYQYWAKTIAPYLNERLDLESHDTERQYGDARVVVNLASQEYFKSVNSKLLNAHVVECVFEDSSGDGAYKVLSFFAKKARGMMARFAIERRIGTIDGLKTFTEAGYAYAKAASLPDRLVFRRIRPPGLVKQA
jgi:cytoplasmic iron level regulating protein YaaA (DUF328/UPF0246 family)